MIAADRLSSCWAIYTPDGHEWAAYGHLGGDHTMHYRTQASARTAITRAKIDAVGDATTADTLTLRLSTLDTLHVARLDAPCMVLTCDGCGHTYDEDEAGIVHFSTPADADSALSGLGWSTDGDGYHHCPGLWCGPFTDEHPRYGPGHGQLDLLTGEAVP